MSRWLAIATLGALGCSSAAPGPRTSPPAQPIADDSPDVVVPEPKVLLFADILAEHRAAARARRLARPWLRGSTHVHTVYSGDSRTKPKDVVRWYTEHGYDFIVITDHNRVTDKISADLKSDSLIVIEGTELTNNPPSCEPPPPEPKGKCRVHVNSLFVTTYPKTQPATRPEKIEWREKKSIERVDLYQAALTKSAELGGLAQLNHPTWHWGTDGALATALAARGMRFIEIANVAFDRWNQGDTIRPGTEAIWDAALTAGHELWGVASDDAHHYYDVAKIKAAGGALYPAGGGFVMVRAERDADSIRAAMASGDFYASTGIVFDRLEVEGGDLLIEVQPTERRRVGIEFISAGKIIDSVKGNSARFDLSRVKGSYVRARVSAADGSRAWTQPVFVD